MDPALAFALAVITPGLAGFLIGSGLRLVARTRGPQADSLAGVRISLVGLVLIFAVPGVAVLVAVATGRLLWPAVLGSVVCLAYAVRMVRVAGRQWNQAAGDTAFASGSSEIHHPERKP